MGLIDAWSDESFRRDVRTGLISLLVVTPIDVGSYLVRTTTSALKPGDGKTE